MTYRNERDALRGRIQGLEQDLQDARRSQQDDEAKRARIAQIEARMREAEGNLRMMRTELESLGGASRPKNSSRVALVVAAAVVLLGAGMASVLIVSKPVMRPVNTPPNRVVEAPAVPIAEVPVPKAEPQPVPAQPEVPARRVDVQWNGKVTRANGLGAGSGAPCVVSATLESKGEKPRIPSLSVQCGGKPVYRSSDKLEGMSMSSSGFAEEPGKEAGTFAYAIKYSDTGARSGPRTQLSLDTTQGQGVVWSDVVPIFRVEFSVPALSAPVRGERLMKEKSESDQK
ncbi:MAG: hypothetical protein IPM54_22165 [Polyangiaceae bacterium]|nr:hypothetical protein [Polyangiaceae bacterium]